MSWRRTWATTRRVLQQLHHDPRTLGLVLFVPTVLILLLKYVYQDQQVVFQHIVPMILGLFPLVAMFLVTSIAMLRERTSGTLERLMTLPMTKLDLILGYGVAFALLALVHACIASGVTLGLLGIVVAGGTTAVLITAVLAGLLGMAMGLLMSAFATSEFQAVQFMPAFIMPQLLIGGFFVPREHMAIVLRWLSDVCPLTYVIEAMRQVMSFPAWTGGLTKDLLVALGFCIIALVLGAATLRRQE